MEASDLELLIARLPKTLGVLKISATPRPKPVKHLTIDEEKFGRMLAAERKDGDATSLAIKHDVDVVTAVHRLRGGQRKHKLELSGAVFVTTNYPMITVTRQFFQEEYEQGGIAHCYGDSTFETLVWLKKPLRAPDLPRRRLLADCLAALRPSEELWSKYSMEIERLRATNAVTADDFVVLKHTLEAKTALLDITKGDAAAFGEGTVQEVLRRSRAAVVGEAADEISMLREQIEAANSAESKRKLQIATRSSTIARHTCRGLLWVLLPLLCFLAYLTLPSNGLSHHFEKLIAPVVLVAFIVLDGITILGFSVGSKLSDWLQSLEIRLQRALTSAQYSVAGLSDDETEN
jgi:hypothetical protein